MYLPNGFSEEVNTDDDLPFDLRAMIPAGKFIVGYVGTLGLANAMSYVIQAVRMLREHENIHFIILGDGYLKEDLIKEATGLINITFLPKIKKGVVSKVVSRFDLGIISWHKSPLYQFGVSANKLFDYMYAAKPILFAGDVADNPVEKANCGICIEPENPEVFRQAILKFYFMDKTDRENFGKNGRSYLLKYHSYPVLAAKLFTWIQLASATDGVIPKHT